MGDDEKPVIWHYGEIKTPPFSKEARIEAGTFLGKLQQGERLSLPHSRPMPTIGRRCHELRIKDKGLNWRIIYRNDADAVVVVEVFAKKTNVTPKKVIDNCRRRLREYDEIVTESS